MGKVEAFIGFDSKQVMLVTNHNNDGRITFLNKEEVEQLIKQLKYAKKEIHKI